MSAIRSLGLGLLLLVLGSCMASNVVAPEERQVARSFERVNWEPATAAQLEGFFVARSIEGSLAESLAHINYLFEKDGRFTAAALLRGEDGLDYQVLSGTYHFEGQNIVLGEGGIPALLESGAGGFLRIKGSEGSVVLQREELP